MIEQRSKEWFKQREGRVTGSAIGAILGLSAWATADDVLRRMAREYQGLPPSFTGNIATEYGTRNEPLATADLELLIGDIDETGFHQIEDWLGASPDGLLGDDYVIEIKCPYGKRNATKESDFLSLKVQTHYYAQVQFEMYCTGRKKAWFYQWSPVGGEKLEEIKYDKAFIDDALPRLKKFHDRYLKERSDKKHAEPLKKKLEDDEAILLSIEYAGLVDHESKIKDRKKRIIDKLVDMSEGDDCIVNGMNLTHVTKQGAISYAKAVKAIAPDVDLEPYRGKPSAYWLFK